MKNDNLSCLIIALAALLFAACQRSTEHKYIIGISQCNDDAWRRKMNRELETKQIFYPEFQLMFRQANANSEVQSAQIDSFIQEKIDLLIVCPNEAAEVQSAVTRAHSAGIPVVIADRRVSGGAWTAFVGGDNLQVGVQLGNWLNQLQKEVAHPIHVIEVSGLTKSTPAVARHRGLIESTRKNQNVVIDHSVSGEWFRDPAFRVVDSLLTLGEQVDAIVAHNDLMAVGAAQACNRHNLHIPIIGVDAISGPDGGLEAIINGDITASALYPSRGDILLDRAAQILYNKDFPRETHLETMIIDRNSARSMQEIALLLETDLEDLQKLQERIQILHSHHELQTALLYTLISFFIALIIAAVATYYVTRYRNGLRREREEHANVVRRQQEQLDKITAELKQTKAAKNEEELFLDRLKQEIEKHLEDSDLEVEKIAQLLGVSRTVLFRKTKNATGQSPIELIHHIRLHKAQELLKNTDLTVQQVAYSVGFSTASYFAKLYKQEFGVNPNDVRR